MVSKSMKRMWGACGVAATVIGGAAGVTMAQSRTQAPPKPAVERPGERQVFTFAGKRVLQGTGHSEVALSTVDTEGRMTMQDEVWAPDFNVPAHFHRKHTEIFYVISGNVEWTVNGETHVMGPGDVVYIPSNTVHATRVVGGKSVHTIMIYEPGGYEESDIRESMFTPEQRKDPKIMKALEQLGDFHVGEMPKRP